MTVEEKLKTLIVSRYGSMINFSKKIDIANSTLATIMIRGVQNASINNVIKICKALDISVDGLANGEIIPSGDHKTSTWRFEDIDEVIPYIRTSLQDSPKVSLNGKKLTKDRLQLYLEYLESSTELFKKSQK